jgi:AcrR family transcriptional regulator
MAPADEHRSGAGANDAVGDADADRGEDPDGGQEHRGEVEGGGPFVGVGDRFVVPRAPCQAQRTKAEIAAAARRCFTANGWAATAIREVAEAAGVAVPTVYAAYGNKTGLALALADAADLTADPAAELAEFEAAEGDPPRQLAAMAAYDRRLFERSGDLIAMVRDAGRTEPELAADYRDARGRADAFRTEVFASWPHGALTTDVAESVEV